MATGDIRDNTEDNRDNMYNRDIRDNGDNKGNRDIRDNKENRTKMTGLD